MLTIGLTGDVGAGKSTLCSVWREMGAAVFDADTVARDMWSLRSVRSCAARRWGKGFFKGEKKEVFAKIANIIFNDEHEYEFASKLLHRHTIEELERMVKNSSGWVVVEIPLLFECGVPPWIDKIVFASAPTEKRVQRNIKRSWNMEEISRRESKLLPREEKIKRADYVLENLGTEDEWRAKGRALGEKFLRMAKAG